MPLSNLRNTHLTDQKATAIQNALKTLETSLAEFNVNLLPEERQKYGSVNEQHKLFINKVRDYRRTNQELSSPDVDWAEFEADHKSRTLIEDILLRLDILRDRLKNTKILHDYDNYQAALDDYSYTNYKAGSQAVGFASKLEELKQFFAKRAKNPSKTEEVKGVKSSTDTI